MSCTWPTYQFCGKPDLCIARVQIIIFFFCSYFLELFLLLLLYVFFFIVILLLLFFVITFIIIISIMARIIIIIFMIPPPTTTIQLSTDCSIIIIMIRMPRDEEKSIMWEFVKFLQEMRWAKGKQLISRSRCLVMIFICT